MVCECWDQCSQNFRDTPHSLFNFFDMPGPDTDFMALRNVPHGRVEAVIDHSSKLGKRRRVPGSIGLIRTGDATPYANIILESA